MGETSDLKSREYFERHSYWQNIAISHTSFSINLFLTLSLAFIGFIVNSSNIGNLELNFSVTHPDWSVTLIFFSVICGGLSILCGVFCVLSRIADFNLTRNAVYARKKFYAEKGDKLTTRKEKTQGKWISIIFNTQKILISSEYIKSEDKELINKKLANIIYWKDLLGVKTWLFHKIQIGFFSFMVIFWILSVFIN